MWRKLLFGILFVFGVFSVWNLSHQPSNNRDWALDQKVAQTAEFDGHKVTVRNIRNFSYITKSDFTPSYYDKTFDFRDLKRVWYVSEPFAGFFGAAHTFLSFEFEGETFLSISVEIRKEKGETFSAWKGVLRSYELIYVAGDERDLIKLRSNYRKDIVYVYPLKTSPEDARTLFVDMLERMNAVIEKPEFYNTLTNSCMTNIVRHYRTALDVRIPYTHEVLFPAYGDALLYREGIIDTDLSFEDARNRFHINERAEKYADSPDFSVRIRTEE
jgi:hypothetical protein